MVTPSIHTYFHVTEPMNKDCFAFEGPLLIPILSDFQSDVRRGVPLYSYNVNRLVQFSSVQSFERLGHRGDMRDDSAGILFQSFSAGGHREQFWLGQGCLLFDVVHPAFPLPTTASPTLQGDPKDGFGEAVLECDMPESIKFPSLDSCQKRFF